MFFDDSIPRLKVKATLIALPLALSIFFLGATLANADDIFMQAEGVKGESDAKGFEEAIEVLGWSWEMNQSGSTRTAAGGGAGVVAVQDLSFTHYVDAATPALMKYCATGKHIPAVHLTLRKMGLTGEPYVYVIIDLEDVIVSNIATSGAASASRATEEVSLNFGKVSFSYQRQDAKGEITPAESFAWDIAKNTAM